MLALVTGGAGFIGSHIVDALLAKGYKVRILDALTEPVHPGGRIPDYLSKEAELIIGDVRDKAAVSKALEGVDVVFHEGAHQGYLPDYSTFFDVNSVGTSMLFEVIAEKKLNVKKIIIASSQAVYGEGQYFCPQHGELQPMPRPIERLAKGQWEHTCPICGETLKNLQATEKLVNPNTQYAISKYSQELIGHNLGRRHGIPVVCLRYSITLGKRQSFYNMYTGILRSFATLLTLGQSPIIFEDGMLMRDYIHIDDVVSANMCVLESPDADYQSFNVGSGISTTVLEFYKEISEYMNSSLKPVMNGEFRVGDVRHIVSSPAKLEALGWKPQKNLRNMIADYLEYLNKAENLEDYFASAMRDMKNKTAIMKSQI
ncbi:NAD-dependent epimerase/dehydratase family protein [Acetivibrio cellulolyticus]|uniref:NAD-dependent epimerase/dehydratase family protein n=1 Tax=Acetivibrio cellulolyticus TaxID=35830 RepID=UPI0001E2FAE9|nr:NAD-dependent epimerase/dehydratase family protein [Acetivibrio cellulolyticus]